jgi:hypothetical protein
MVVPEKAPGKQCNAINGRIFHAAKCKYFVVTFPKAKVLPALAAAIAAAA